MPRVISPSKGHNRQRNNEATNDDCSEDVEDSSSDDSDFVNSDYDLEDDDGLFVDNVDVRCCQREEYAALFEIEKNIMCDSKVT